MSRGIKAVLSYAPQTDSGTKPVTGWKDFPRVSDSLNNTVELVDSETIVDSRLKTPGMVISAEAMGDVECELIASAYDDFMEAAAGNTWVGDKLTFGGDVAKIFALQKHNKDIDQYHYWSGMRVNTMKLEIPEKALMKLNFGFMGQGYQTAATVFAGGTTAATPTAPKASSLNVTDIKIDDGTLKNVMCATAFDMEVNNNIESTACLGDGVYANNLLEYAADITGSITIAYNKKSQALIDKQMTGATIKLEVLITFPDPRYSYTLTIPKAQISGDLPSGGKDRLDASLNYTVVAESADDAPFITRTKPVVGG